MKKFEDSSSEEDFSQSDEEYRPLKSKRGIYPKYDREKPKTGKNLVHVCSILLGAALMAPFMVIICSAEDMLSGSRQATGLVIVAATAPSFLVKFCFLLCKSLRNISSVIKTLVTYVFIVVGMLCVAFSQTSLKLRYGGVCLISLGISVGEIGLLIIAATQVRERALSSLITGSAVGGILSTVPYVAMTSWSDINPRAALLVPVVWPSLYLLMFAVIQLKNLGKPSYQIIPQMKDGQPNPRDKSSSVRRFMAVWKVLDRLLLLYVSYFSVFLSIGAILTTLVFTHSKTFGPREDFHHYVLSIVIGQFFGRSFMSLLLAKTPDISCVPFQALGTFFSTFFMFIFLFGSWNRFIHHIWLVFGMCFLQGTFLGILTIVSYQSIADKTREPHIVFLLILASLLETFGVLCAGLIGLHTEPSLYRHCTEVTYGNTSRCLTRSSNPDFWIKGESLLTA